MRQTRQECRCLWIRLLSRYDSHCKLFRSYQQLKFLADGEWQHTIVDDKLYTRAPDYDEAQDERVVWDDINRVDSAEEYRKAHLTGSRALYFAQCSDENETWLPLLEKAYAKAHGDFASIDGGFTGEAIEDLTGGVTTEIYSTDILDREAFWCDELMKVGQEFLFGCATGFYANWLDTSGIPREREGISEGHAYSIMDAKEIKGQRLLKLRNPWGKKEWTGRWSDGSVEWTPEWMRLLDHKFGNDGIFWISYEDLLKKYQHFDRTRIFGPEWNVTQSWTSVDVSWSAEYHSTKFSLTLEEKAPVVIVLAQLDDTYFGGLEGGYGFDLQFRLESDDKEDDNDYIVRSNGNYAMARSVSTDIELDAGTYSVLVKITATRNMDREHVEDVLPVYAATRREKLIQMGLSYDLAHAKGVHIETEAERKENKAREKERRAKQRQKSKERAKRDAERHWKRQKKQHELDKLRNARNKQRRQRKHRANGSAGPQKEVLVERVVEKVEIIENGVAEKPQKEAASVKEGDGKSAGDTNPAPVSEEKASEEVSATKVVEPLADVLSTLEAANRTESPVPEDSSPPQAPNDAPETDGAADKKEQASSTGVKFADTTTTITDLRPLSGHPLISRPEHEISINGQHNHVPRRSDTRDTLDTTAAMVGIGSGTEGSERARSEDADGILNNEDEDEDDENGIRNPNEDEDEGPSDADSFPPFDWNSDVDFPFASSESESDSDDDNDTTAYPRRMAPRYRPPYIRRGGAGGRGRGRSRSPPLVLGPPPPAPGEYVEIVENPGPKGGAGDDAGDDNGPEEPWNAICVIGLRVYSTLKGEGVKLKVVRPSAYADDEAKDKRKKQEDKGDKDKVSVSVNGDAPDETTATAADEIKLDPDDISKGAVAVEPESTGVLTDGGDETSQAQASG